MTDALNHALDQMRAIGLIIRDKAGDESLHIDGKIHRVDVEGTKRGKLAGWYMCLWMRLDNGNDVIVGAYGIFQGDQNYRHKLTIGAGTKLNNAERERFKARQKELAEASEAERAKRAAEAAKRAAEIWLGLPYEGISEYLQRKGVKAWGVRFTRGSIAVPLKNVAGKMVGLQFIAADGSKKFLTGTAKLGAWHLIGEIKAGLPLVLAEGYATAATIHEATGWPVAVCFDCGNLLTVGKALRSLHPEIDLLIAGDDDHEKVDQVTGLPVNAGRTHGDRAALALRCGVVYPAFTDPAGRSDFNDLQAERGLEVVRTQLQAQQAKGREEPSDEEPDPSWRQQLVYGDRGLKPMVQNVLLIMEHHPAWKGVFGYDAFQKRLVMRRPPPHGAKPGPLTDGDEIEIAAWFGRRETFGLAVPTLMAREASIAIARRSPFHPVCEYLDSLKWDGTDRIPTFFSDFCGVKQNSVSEAFALNFFISCVARVRKPGCKADLMLVLEGDQGAYKSTLAKVLCGDDWFADLGTAASDKDFYQIIQGRWIVEISELASFAKSENSHIKRAISTSVDTFRPSYGRNAESYPRECIFFGTVNNSNWQRDETGGRRYMPLWVTEIDIDAIRAIRDQLWAEASVRYARGEAWWKLPPEAKEEQELRYEDDVWTGRIMAWLDGRLENTNSAMPLWDNKRLDHATTAQILTRALDVEPKKQDRTMQMRVGAIMRRLGWARKLVRVGSARLWQYHRPATAEVQP